MTEIEQKALVLLNKVQDEQGYVQGSRLYRRDRNVFSEALCRAIEQREAIKQELSDFRQEVSDAVLEYYGGYHNASGEPLERFIITKPPTVLFVTDPLATAMAEIGVMPNAGGLRDALDALGFEIREKNDG